MKSGISTNTVYNVCRNRKNFPPGMNVYPKEKIFNMFCGTTIRLLAIYFPEV